MKKLILLLLCVISLSGIHAQTSYPYSSWYGYNKTFDDYTPHSSIQVKAPYSSGVIVIVRQNDKDGRVCGHRYISSGSTASIDLPNGRYQVFFYYGSDWSSSKDMGGGIKGGFLENEVFAKDNPVTLMNNVLSYELVLQRNGNFNTKASSRSEVF